MLYVFYKLTSCKFKEKNIVINYIDINDMFKMFKFVKIIGILSTGIRTLSGLETAKPTTPRINVTSPVYGDIAIVGEEYTILFDFEDEEGSRTGRFDIDLYHKKGEDDCGTYATPLCEKHNIGCRDTAGDYDIEIPYDTTPGYYRVRVGLFEDESLFDCSDVFEIVEEFPFSFSFSFSYDI